MFTPSVVLMRIGFDWKVAVEKQTSSAIRQEVFEKDHELGELVHRIQKLFWMGDKDEARALLEICFDGNLRRVAGSSQSASLAPRRQPMLGLSYGDLPI